MPHSNCGERRWRSRWWTAATFTCFNPCSTNARVWLAEATGIDVAGRRVLLDDDALPYDSLVVATGVSHHYFGRDDWEAAAPGLKTIEDATEIRCRVLTAFEAAEREPDDAVREAWLTFAVVGGGPTGVELACGATSGRSIRAGPGSS
jgi:NADH dehydrogenase